MVDAIYAAQSSLRAGAGVPPGVLGTTELADALVLLAEIESQTQALRMSLMVEADSRRVADSTADTGTDAWLATLTGDRREVLRGGLWIAQRLQEKYDATREAFARGDLRLDQVRVIVQAAEAAPAAATPEQIRYAEEDLVAKATGEAQRSGRPLDARRLRQVARRMFDSIDTSLADQQETEMLEREERRAEIETWFMLSDNGDGTHTGRFVIPELHGNILRAALERLTAPRRLSREKSGATVIDPTAQPALGRAEHFGIGLCELIEHLPTRGHAANGTEVIVTMPLESLLTRIGAAALDTGVRISAGEARRLACEASIIPMVLDGKSVVLDQGRRKRLHTRNQRRALAVRYDTCAIGGCERPFAWCEIHHHELPWAKGGRTDLSSALPLCGHHHRRAHDSRWDLRQHPSGDYRFHRRR